MAEQWKHFSIVKEKNICTVLLNSPPVNVITRSLMEELSGDDAKQLVVDMNRYMETGEKPVYDDNPFLRIAWRMIGARLDADAERYARTVAKNQEAANKRWEQEMRSAADSARKRTGSYL